MPRNFVVAGLFSAVLVFTTSPLISQNAPTTPPQGGPHRPLPKPTNLQVLPKDTSPEDLMKIMHGFEGQLGVECEFCHERDAQTHKLNFASDKVPDKAIARTMISMTQEINAKYLSQVQDPDATPEIKTVTCGTCHRGAAMPEVFKPKPNEHEHHSMPMQKPQ